VKSNVYEYSKFNTPVTSMARKYIVMTVAPNASSRRANAQRLWGEGNAPTYVHNGACRIRRAERVNL